MRLLSRKSELRGLARRPGPGGAAARQALEADAGLPRAGPRAVELLQQRDHPLVARRGRGRPPATRSRRSATVYKETAYGLAGIAGESRSQDANGQYIRVAGGGGTNTVTTLGQAWSRRSPAVTRSRHVAFDLLGAVPAPGPRRRRRSGPTPPVRTRRRPTCAAASGAAAVAVAGRRTRRLAAAGVPAAQAGKIARPLERDPRRQSSEYGDAARPTATTRPHARSKKDLDKSVKRFYKEVRAADGHRDPQAPPRLRRARPAARRRRSPSPTTSSRSSACGSRSSRSGPSSSRPSSRPPRPSSPARARRSGSPASRSATSTRSSSRTARRSSPSASTATTCPSTRTRPMLLRPTTGLKDMFFQLDPGSRSAGEIEEGGTIPLANTAPGRQPRRDPRRARQRHPGLPAAAARPAPARASTGAARTSARCSARWARSTATSASSTPRSRSARPTCARLITNFNQLTGAVGKADSDLTRLVESSATALGAIAEQDPNVQRAVGAAARARSSSRARP